MTYYIDRQTEIIFDIEGYILGFEFDYKLGRTLQGYAVFREDGEMVKTGFATKEDAQRYCYEMEYELG